MYDIILTANYSPWSSYHGGIQKSADQLGQAFSQLGLRTAVIYSRSPTENIQPPPRPYDIYWVPFFALKPGISSPGRFLNAVGFQKLIRQLLSPRTIIQANGDEAWLLPSKFPGRVIYSHRQPYFPSYLKGNWHNPIHRAWVFLREPREWAYARALLDAERVTCTSQFSAQQLQSLFPLLNPPEIIPNGVDPVFLTTPLSRQEKHILYFGRLSRGKGLIELVRAWQSLPYETRREFPLHCIGNGELKEWLLRESALCPSDAPLVVHPSMPPQELAQAIGKAAIVALPSASESFGNTMLETIAMGNRPITCKTGAIPEVVGHHADLIDQPDISLIARALRDRIAAWNGPEPESLRRERRQWVATRFSWKKSAKQFIQIHEELRTSKDPNFRFSKHRL